MAATVKASTEGLERIDKARRKKGWAKAEKAWADLACTSEATLKRFWAGVAIRSDAFRDICQVVGIDDWESLVDFEDDGDDDESQLQISSRRLSFAIAGSIEEIDKRKLDAIVGLLRKLGGDATIEIVDLEEGSIKLILVGSEEALERIEALFQSGELTHIEKTEVQDVHFLETRELASLIQKNGGTALNLSRTNLSDATLLGVTLRGADLSNVDLSDANLSDVDLSDANLNNAILKGANLTSANLRSANLKGALLNYADLSDVDLSNANLNNANLSNANLSDAALLSATLFNANLRGANLSDALLSHANLLGASLLGANLRGALLLSANLSDADLSDADLSGVDLSSATVARTKMFRNEGLSSTSMKDLMHRGAVFDDSPGDRSSSYLG